MTTVTYPPEILDLVEGPKKLNVLDYGESGTGKTRLIGTASKKFKTLIASAEKGLLSINKYIDEFGVGKGIKEWRINSYEDLDKFKTFVLAGNHDFECIALDSGTEIQQRCMEKILRDQGRDKAQQADWGTLGSKMAYMTRELRDSKYNFIMTALAETVVDQTTGEQKVMPKFQGMYQTVSVSLFDEVFYSHAVSTKKENGEMIVEYRLLTKNSGKFQAKDRGGYLPTIVEPDFCKIFELTHERPKKEVSK